MQAADFANEVVALNVLIERAALSVAQLRRDLLVAALQRAPCEKYNPAQPRVPAGHPDGGQWTSGSDGGAAPQSFEGWLAGGWASGPSEWTAADDAEPQIEEVSNRPRGGAGRWPEATLGQQARLAAIESQASAAVRRVQEIDPRWRPSDSISEGIEGAILSNQAALRQAEGRLRDLQAMGIGPGPFAQDPLPARGPGRLNREEQAETNRKGRLFGCHTCGTTDPGTRNGNFIGDHQYPSSLNRNGQPQVIHPHCASCSLRQGGFVRPFVRRAR